MGDPRSEDLPSGTVTFLFTDIEGSTRLLQRLGERYDEVLEEHIRLLRETFSRRGGREVGTQGDALFVVFPRADDAVQAAAEAQRALARHVWPHEGEVRVRMGLHTGQARVVRHDYIGLDVHRAARISAAAHGGQVLLSAATRRFVDAGLDDGLALRDLGEHRLKDLAEPVRLFQLVAEDLPADFPEPRSLEGPARALPAELTSLVGREREVEEVSQLLARDDVRLVTLTGPGGAGKTRLAVRVAERWRAGTPHDLSFAELAPIDDPAVALSAIAQALGVEGEADGALRQSVERFLAQRRILLVLDNLEQLRDAGPLVAGLLTNAPTLTVLATSRTPLRVPGEREYTVAGLSRDNALALFAERARAVDPAFELTPANTRTVSELLRRLDGLPLAIEVAAARVRAITPAQLLQRLGNRLTLLSIGGGGRPERHRTLRATVDWSYRLLSDDERAVFDRLGIFSGSFTLAAAEAICGGDGSDDVLGGVEALVESSLLRREDAGGEPRFRMLETIRSYALERLGESGKADELRRRHAEHYAAFAEEAEVAVLRGGEQAAWLDRVEAEHDNARAALAWAHEAGETELELRLAGAMRGFWYVRGYLSEGRRWLEQALAAGGPQPDDLRAKALRAAFGLAQRQGRHEEAAAYIDEAVEIYRRLGDEEGVSRSLNNLATLALARGDRDGARALFEETVELARKVDDLWTVARASSNLGYVALMEGNFRRASRLSEESLALHHELGSSDDTAIPLQNLGYVALHRGDLPEARRLFEQSLALCERVGWREGVGYAMEGLAAVLVAEGRPRDAAVVLGTAEALRDEIGSSLEPLERAMHERTVAAAREALGEEALGEAWARGRAGFRAAR